MQLFEQTIEKDIFFGLKQYKLTYDEKYKRAKEALELLGLDFERIKDKSPLTLSGGEKGRVALTALMLRKDNLRHGVEVSIQNDKLVIELHIIVAYEVSILAVAENLVDNVKYKVEEFTGMEVGKIVVCVEGVRVIN